MKARKKPVVVEAVKWNGNNAVEIYNFLEDLNVESQWEVKTEGKNFFIGFDKGQCVTGTLIIKTLEGNHIASVGDYIIKGIKGEFYPCKPDIFEKTYDVVDDDEIDLQLTIEEINALICYISKSIGVFDADLLNTLKLAYMLGEENLSLCINAIDKLQNQKEKLENEKNND